VGLIQQFMIKYGQIGIPLPFTDVVFKPSPPLVPASTVVADGNCSADPAGWLVGKQGIDMKNNASFLTKNRGILIFFAVMLLAPFVIGLFEGSTPLMIWNNQGSFSKFL